MRRWSEAGRAALATAIAFVALGCGDAETTPSVVAYSWEVQISGTAEPIDGVTRVDFDGIRWMDYLDTRFDIPFAESTPLRLAGTATGGALPPRLNSLAAAQETGVRFVAMTYCGFENAAGIPSDEDVAVVTQAVELLRSAIADPLQRATISQDSLKAAGVSALEELESILLTRLRGQRLSAVEAELLRDIRFRIDNEYDTDFESLLELLPAVAWALADKASERSLRACGTLLFFDLSEEVRNQEFPWREFPGSLCNNSNVSTESIACSLEAWESGHRLDRREVRLQSPYGTEFDQWYLEPWIRFTPL